MSADKLKDYYTEFLVGKRADKDIQKQIIYNLFKRPPKLKNSEEQHYRSKADGLKQGQSQQIDLLFLPNDNGHKYALVVIDQATRKIDAEPLKTKEGEAVFEALKKIYSGQRVFAGWPENLEFDAGGEFNKIKNYLKSKKIAHRAFPAGRHAHLVERANQTIGAAIHKRQYATEMLTGEPDTKWTKILPELITLLNKRTAERKFLPQKNTLFTDKQVLLPVGTKVRVLLDKPIDTTTGQRLHGTFRSGDVKWSPEIRTIENIAIRPSGPVLYLLNNNKKSPITYYRKQLLVVGAVQEYPPGPDILPRSTKKYIVEKLLDRKKERNVVSFLVKYRGFPDSYNLWQKRSELIKDVPDMVKEYEDENK